MRNSTNTPGDGVEWHVHTSKQSPEGTPKGSADIGVGALGLTPKATAAEVDTTATRIDVIMALLNQRTLARNPPTPRPTAPQLTKKSKYNRKLFVSRGSANAGDGDGDGGNTEQSATSTVSVNAIAAGSMLAGVVLTVVSAVIWRKRLGPSASDVMAVASSTQLEPVLESESVF